MNTKIDAFYTTVLDRVRNQYPVLSQKEAGELAKKARNGDLDARNRLVLSNLCLIHVIARECNIPNSDIEDMIQDGYVELIEQASKFDYEKGASFSTFIWLWIKQRIYRSNISISERNFNLISKVNKFRETFVSIYERTPTEAEIADALGLDVDVLHSKLNQIEYSSSVSLDGMACGDSDSDSGSLYDVDLGYSSVTPEEEAVKNEIITTVRKAVESLPEKESLVIKYRNCMNNDGEKGMSFREIGSIMNISQETVRNYEKKAKIHLKEILSEQGIMAA